MDEDADVIALRNLLLRKMSRRRGSQRNIRPQMDDRCPTNQAEFPFREAPA